MRAIQLSQTGGPDVLEVVDLELRAPGPGEVQVRHRAIGVNFIDTYQRSGLYPMRLPAVLGGEGAGTVEAVGEGVTHLRIGDRVAYSGGSTGGYAEAAVLKAARAAILPDTISFETAAAAMLKGMTAEFLVRRCAPVKPGQTILVQAAAGGVGTILVQWIKALGGIVIGTVGSEEKAKLARSLGADHIIFYRDEDVAAKVRDITGGAGVPIAYDSVGAATFEGTLASLSKRGVFVSFGNASGPVPPLAPLRLSQAGSVFLTRPTMGDYLVTQAEWDDSVAALFGVIGSGQVKIEIGQTFPLGDARAAHEALHSRDTIGATLLIP